tara:strand:- start:98 stop:1381 length:1284 start_codon:yes stop_codon:yes gene_type:complete
MKYKYFAPWDKLKTVVLGSFYDVEFFSTIKNDFIRSSLSKIAEETNEDLENYQNVLKDFGCEVLRPKLNPNDRIDRYIDDGKVNYINPFGRVRTVPRPPLQTRDSCLVVKDKLYITHGDHSAIFECLDEYNKEDQVVLDFDLDTLDQSQKDELHEKYYKVRKTESWPSLDEIYDVDPSTLDPMTQMEVEYFQKYSRESMVHLLKAPCMTLIGKDLIVESALFDLNRLQKIFDLRFSVVNEGGHSDGCFSPLVPGAIMTVKSPTLYSRTFPGWDVLHLPGHAKSSKFVSDIHAWKDKIGGRWYIDGSINEELIEFTDTYLSELTGFTIETIFDVNCLVLDRYHVCVSNLIPEAEEFFRRHKIEPIVVPFRHRHFHDGGLHCITLDLYREGEMIDYFPDREQQSIIDGSSRFAKIIGEHDTKPRGFSWN